MKILGSRRGITQSFENHQYEAEDYAGEHLSDVKIFGTAKVISIVDKYKSHEHTINYNDFLKNVNKWRDGNYYNCISITGNKVRYHHNELGGNEVWLETFFDNEKKHFRITHLDAVLVKIGDIIDSNTIIGKQGNTGLVLSNKPVTDITYGSHIHFEVRDENYNFINPRSYAVGDLIVNYIPQSNEINNNQKQIKIIADIINIREKYTVNSNNIGNVYKGEIYTVLDEINDNKYTWYKINTNRNSIGFVASLKNGRWIEVLDNDRHIDIVDDNYNSIKNKKIENIFECKKDGLYAIRLKKGESIYIS